MPAEPFVKEGAMPWSVVNFGPKFKGKTLPQIIFDDPDWFFWGIEKDIFSNKGDRRMRVPAPLFEWM